MLSFPLIARELRVQARKRSTYRARLGWGITAVGLLLFFSLGFPDQSASGTFFLATVHVCLAVMLFFVAPLGASDAISRERREGTLGILLLTRLTPAQVVLGKLAAHVIRVFYLGFMMLPFLVIPVLLGGVEAQDFLASFAMLFTLALLGVAAGLIASAVFLSFGAALAWAIVLAALLGLIVPSVLLNGALELFPNSFPPDVPGSVRFLLLGPGLLIFPLWARNLAGMFAVGRWFLPALELCLMAASILVLIVGVWFAARRIARRGEFDAETKRQAAFRQRFLTPILWREAYRKLMSRSLDRNPFAWLEYRSAWARTARWALILLGIVVETGLLIALPDRSEFIRLHFWMACLVVAFVTLKSSSSFSLEKENGAFELILVTPMTEVKLVLGRLLAVAAYYAPIVFVLLILGLYGLSWSEPGIWAGEFELSSAVRFLSVCASIVSVPVCGLYFALRCRGFLPALLWTAGLAILVPICLWTAFDGLTWYTGARLQWWLATALMHSLREVWWPVLLTVAVYHLALVFRYSRATLDLLRGRGFAATD